MEPDKIRQPRAKRVAQPYSTPTSDEQPVHRTAAQASAEVAQIRRALAEPGTATPDTLLLMQQRYGNQAVQRLIQRKANPLATTVQRGLFSKKQKVPNNIEEATRSDIFPYFHKYCQRKHLDENTNFIKEYRTFKATPDRNLAQHIYAQYIDPNSATNVNIDRKRVNQVVSSLNNTTVNENIFDDVYQDVLVDILYDPYNTFKNNSQEFQEWKKDW